MILNTQSRRIWLIADPHVGHVSDGRDGGDWLALAIADMRARMGRFDYAINLGDMTYKYQPEQFARYVKLRDASGVGPWFEVIGNHDFHGLASGAFERVVGRPRYWELIDGNLAFFSLPAERGNAAGLFLPPVQAWLRQRIAAHADKNVIIAAHQFPCDTVEHSHKPSRCLHPRDAVDRFVREVPIDLWLGGHIHSSPRTTNCSARVGGVSYINVASVSHTYNTEACNSFVLELSAGSGEAVATCRDHDRQCDLGEQRVVVPLRHPVRLGDRLELTPFALDVPAWYSRIDDEEVVSFDDYAKERQA